MKTTTRNKTLCILFMLLGLFLFKSCDQSGTTALGKNIPADIPVTKLSDITAHPEQFHGKTVVLKGTISSQCVSLCDFSFKEGVQQATIFPQGFKLPRLVSGRPVTVYAGVTSGKDNVVFSALGIITE